MGILGWLLPGKRAQRQWLEFEHTVFGTLEFGSGLEWSGWDCSDDRFRGTYSIAIDGDIDGPFPGSIEAYNRLGQSWFRLCEPATHLLTQILVRHFPDAPTRYLSAEISGSTRD